MFLYVLSVNDVFAEEPWSLNLDYSTVGGIVAVIIVVFVVVMASSKAKKRHDE